jgi:hypothetical protein
VSPRGERILWKIVEFLSHAAIVGFWVPAPGSLAQMGPADAGGPSQTEAEPVIDPRELDDWLASILNAEPDSD